VVRSIDDAEIAIRDVVQQTIGKVRVFIPF